MNPLRTEIIRDLVALENLAPRWWDLWRRSPTATPFQSPAWLIPWWRSFHPGALSAIAVHRGEGLVGFAPFYCEESAAGRGTSGSRRTSR